MPGFDPAYMLDQSHNVTDPIESLMTSAVEVVRAYVQAHLVDRDELAAYQDGERSRYGARDVETGVQYRCRPILAMARHRGGGAIDPVAVYRASGYRQRAELARPAGERSRVGIV